jgi:hypothetical protein
LTPRGGTFFIRKPPKMGFLDPRNPEIPNARTKSGEFLGPKLSTPTILPIRAKTGFWGEFFGPLFWLFLGFFYNWLRIGGRIDYINLHLLGATRPRILNRSSAEAYDLSYLMILQREKTLLPMPLQIPHLSFWRYRYDYFEVSKRTDTQLSGRGCLAQLDVRKKRSSSMNISEIRFIYSRLSVPLRYTTSLPSQNRYIYKILSATYDSLE